VDNTVEPWGGVPLLCFWSRIAAWDIAFFAKSLAWQRDQRDNQTKTLPKGVNNVGPSCPA